jgi:3-deoxy-manno-octulosonate cytidylyltransferase (CMP-KDO synthetase)
MRDPGVLLVIPARYASARLPGKLLLRETGKSVIQHTYEAAQRATAVQHICVATDHEKIAHEVRGFGGNVELTEPGLRTDLDRVAAIAIRMPEYGTVVNLQADESGITDQAINKAVDLLVRESTSAFTTIATPIRDREELVNSNRVKVIFDENGRALYFSRTPIPYCADWNDALLTQTPPLFYRQIGLYAYRREVLLRLAEMKQGHLEQLEVLEQLRGLAAGFIIHVGVVEECEAGVDTLQDYQRFARRTFRRDSK